MINEMLEWTKAQQLSNQNPYFIIEPDWDYPPGFQMKTWEEQLQILEAAYRGLKADGLPEMAKKWLARQDIWEQTFVFPLTGESVKVYDGLLVFPLPGKVAATLGLGNPWEDVARGEKGQGLWGKLCEEILFPLVPRFPLPSGDYCQRQMGSDQFLPEEILPVWFQELEASIKGDFACRPISFGRRLAGHSILAAHWENENLISGIPGCSWLVGNGLITHPDRLPGYGHLWLDCPGDRYRFYYFRGFDFAPCFNGYDEGLRFTTYGVGSTSIGHFGSVVLAR